MSSVDDKKAIEALLAIVEADPTDARSRLKLGDLFVRMGDIARAVEMY